jgi:hypothetical protein
MCYLNPISCVSNRFPSLGEAILSVIGNNFIICDSIPGKFTQGECLYIIKYINKEGINDAYRSMF